MPRGYGSVRRDDDDDDDSDDDELTEPSLGPEDAGETEAFIIEVLGYDVSVDEMIFCLGACDRSIIIDSRRRASSLRPLPPP